MNSIHTEQKAITNEFYGKEKHYRIQFSKRAYVSFYFWPFGRPGAVLLYSDLSYTHIILDCLPFHKSIETESSSVYNDGSVCTFRLYNIHIGLVYTQKALLSKFCSVINKKSKNRITNWTLFSSFWGYISLCATHVCESCVTITARKRPPMSLFNVLHSSQCSYIHFWCVDYECLRRFNHIYVIRSEPFELTSFCTALLRVSYIFPNYIKIIIYVFCTKIMTKTYTIYENEKKFVKFFLNYYSLPKAI